MNLYDKKCVLVVDGLNQILDEEKETFLSWIIKSDNKNIKIIVSSTSDDVNAQYLIANNVNTLLIKNLDNERKQAFISSYLAKNGKKIDSRLLSLILRAEIFNNTLSLKIFLDAIILFSSYESIQSDVEQYTSCESACDFYHLVLNAYDAEFGFSLLQKICSYIFVSKQGIYVDEIISLCDITPLQWAQIYRMLKVNLSEETGKIKFIHSKFADAINLHYLQNDSAKVLAYKKNLISLLESKDHFRTNNELPYHYNELRNYEALYNYLMQIDVATYFLKYNSMAFASFWKNLSNYKPTYLITDYIKLEYKDVENVWPATDFFISLGIFTKDVLKDLFSAEKIFQHSLELSENANKEFEILLDELAKDLDDIQVLTTPDSLRYTGSFCNLGDVKYDAGLFEEALKYYHKAIGFLSDSNLFFDISEISKKIDHIQFFNYDDREYYRVAYGLHRLGMTYDDLSYKKIACLIYSKAADYLKLCNDEDIDLLGKIYHDWAISLSDFNPEKSIKLLDDSLSLFKRSGGMQDERVTETLCNKGALNEKMGKKVMALECYNLAIDLEMKFRGETRILGILFCNRSIVQETDDRRIEDIWNSISIFLKLGCIEEVSSSYKWLGHTYFNKQDYTIAFNYYLISYNLLYIYCGKNASNTVSVEQDVLECLHLVIGKEELSYDTMVYLSIYYHNTKIKVLNYEEMCDILNLGVGNLLYILTKDNMLDDVKNKGIISSSLYIMLPFIDEIYKNSGMLPFDNVISIKALILAIYCSENKNLYKHALNLISEYEVEDGFEYWELQCFHLYFRNELTPLQSEDIETVISQISIIDLKKSILNEDDLILDKLAYILNGFICDTYIPNRNYELGLKAVDIVCMINPSNPYFLDTKAELLYRLGKTKETIDLIKRIKLLDANFYPSGNEFLFNAIVKDL